MLRDCHVAIPFVVVHNFSYLPYNNKKDIRIYFMAPYCSKGIRTVIVRMEITGHKQGRKMKDSFIAIFLFLHFRSRSRKITVAMSVLVITAKRMFCKSFRLRWLMSHGSSGENFTISVMDFSVELFFKSLKNHFVEKEDAVNELQLS